MKLHATLTYVAVLAVVMSIAPTATAAGLRGRGLISIFGFEPVTEACSASHVKEMVRANNAVLQLRDLAAELKAMQGRADTQTAYGPTWGYGPPGGNPGAQQWQSSSITDPFAAVASCVGGSNPGAACTPLAACAGVAGCTAKVEKHCKGGGKCVAEAPLRGLLGPAPTTKPATSTSRLLMVAPRRAAASADDATTLCHSLHTHIPDAWCNGNVHTSCATMVAEYPDHCAFGAAPASTSTAAAETAASVPQYCSDGTPNCGAAAFLHACRMKCDALQQCNAFVFHAMDADTHVASCSFHRTTMSKAQANFMAFNRFDAIEVAIVGGAQPQEMDKLLFGRNGGLAQISPFTGDTVWAKVGVPQVALSAALSEVRPQVQALLKQQQDAYNSNPCEKDISALDALAKDIEAAVEWLYKHAACPVIKKAVHYAVDAAEKEGKAEAKEVVAEVCTELSVEIVAACELVGLGPEDPLADICAATLAPIAETECNTYLDQEIDDEIDKLATGLSDYVISKAGC